MNHFLLLVLAALSAAQGIVIGNVSLTVTGGQAVNVKGADPVQATTATSYDERRW